MNEVWHYLIGEHPQGPFDRSQMSDLLNQHQIDANTLVWTAEQSDWMRLSETKLREILKPMPVPVSLPGPPPNPLAPQKMERESAPKWGKPSELPLIALHPLQSWVKRAFYGFVFATALTVPSSAATLYFLYGIQAGTGIDPSWANPIDAFSSGTGIFYLLWLIASALVFSRFVFVAMRNLHRAGAAGVTISPGWAVGWYFVPIANWWKPLQAVREIWRTSHTPRDAMAEREIGFGLWWASWLLGGLLGQIAFRMQTTAGLFSDNITKPELLMWSFAVDIASSLALIVSGLALLPIVREIATAQHKNLDLEG